MKICESKRLGERYTVEKLPNGLTLVLYPMPDFRTAYAGITAEVGSIDRSFSVDGGEPVVLPDGIAHFLEHKMFEHEGVDAFDLYSKTGANANAYTSFASTCYNFSCTDHFAENLRILLEFVSNPWFTEESIAKEQGIIGQEIEMYADDSDWRGFFLMVSSLFSEVPLGAEIAGSRESIAQITPELLYACYRAFYAPSNLTLVVAGPVDPDEVRSVCSEYFKNSETVAVAHPVMNEPREICRLYAEQKMSVALPLFNIGFKEAPLSDEDRGFRPVLMDILLDMLTSDVSALYRRLYDGGLINDTFQSEVMTCREHWLVAFGGESRNPQAVFDALVNEFDRARREGLDRKAFERSRKAIYARLVMSLSTPETTAGSILDFLLTNCDLYDIIERVAAVSFEDVEQLLSETLNGQYAALSVIYPQDETEGV